MYFAIRKFKLDIKQFVWPHSSVKLQKESDSHTGPQQYNALVHVMCILVLKCSGQTKQKIISCTATLHVIMHFSFSFLVSVDTLYKIMFAGPSVTLWKQPFQTYKICMKMQLIMIILLIMMILMCTYWWFCSINYRHVSKPANRHVLL